MTEAAEEFDSSATAIRTAAMGTRRNRFRIAAGFQWAFSGEVPANWPQRQHRGRRALPFIPSSPTAKLLVPCVQQMRVEDIPQKDNLKVGEIAKILKCSHHMVVNLFDEGILPGYRLYDTGPRYVQRATLLDYLRAIGLLEMESSDDAE